MMKPFLWLIILLPFVAKAQPFDPFSQKMQDRILSEDFGRITRLKVGQQVPDVLVNIINGSSANASFREFKGKVVILDFWNQQCGSCMGFMPEIEKLQNKYLDKAIILPITFQSAKSARAALARMSVHPRSIVEDIVLRSFFPHSYEPFEVWIDGDSRVIAITGHEYISEQNIQAAIDGRPLRFANVSPDPENTMKKPLLVNNNFGPDSAFVYRSLISGPIYTVGEKLISYENRDSLSLNITIINGTISYLYKWVYSKLYPDKLGAVKDIPNRKIVSDINIESPNPKIYLPGSYNPKDNLPADPADKFYSYNLTLPPDYSLKQAYQWMIQDLDRFFGIQSSVERRNIPCAYLVSTLNSKSQRLQTDATGYSGYNSDHTEYRLDSGTPEYYANFMNENYFGKDLPFIINKVDQKENIYLPIVFHQNMTLNEIRTASKKFGFDFIPQQKEMDVLILRKRK